VYFDSVVGGSGEFHMTLAALHFADGNTDAALRQMSALADPRTRYATRTAEPREYEAMVASAAAFLLDYGKPWLGEEVVRLHLPELRTRNTFELVYPRLMKESRSATAVALAQQLVDQSSAAETLVYYAQSLYDSGFINQGRNALQKALETADTFAALRPGLDLAIAAREDTLLQQAGENIGQMAGDLVVALELADALRDQGREPAARALLQNVIDRVGAGSEFTVNGESLSATDALAYLSVQAFNRGMLPIADLSAAAALAPLSRVERGALKLATPAAAQDPLRIPNPDRLASPLYLGLLDEQRGRTADAKQRYMEESQSVLADVLDSNGLYVPDMLNHLALLGSTLEDESETLAQLDRVLLRVENDSLQDLRDQQSAALGKVRSELARASAEIDTTLGEIAAMQSALETRDRNWIMVSASALLLALRSLGLLAMCAVCAFVIVRIAVVYASERATQRGYAFGWKLLEGLGWTWVLSIFSAPLGVLAILVSQFFLLFQKRREAAPESGQPSRSLAKPEPSESAKEAKTTTDSRARRSDEVWSEVIQMLREV
jgi:hypothetical protein